VNKQLHYGANSEQGQYWNEISGPKWVEEDSAMNERMQSITAWLFQKAGLSENQKVLDVGCGGGATTEIIAKTVGSHGSVHGIDISKPLLSLASKRCQKFHNVAFDLGDAQTLDLSRNFYDHIISRFGVMFFENPQQAFCNLRKSLKANGKLTFVCWSTLEENEFFSLPVRTVISTLGLPAPSVGSEPGPMSLCDTYHTQKMLINSGFNNVHITTIKTDMSSSDNLLKHAKLYLKIGPAARIMADNDVSKSQNTDIVSLIVEKLKKRQKKNGKISLGATVHYVEAKNH